MTDNPRPVRDPLGIDARRIVPLRRAVMITLAGRQYVLTRPHWPPVLLMLYRLRKVRDLDENARHRVVIAIYDRLMPAGHSHDLVLRLLADREVPDGLRFAHLERGLKAALELWLEPVEPPAAARHSRTRHRSPWS